MRKTVFARVDELNLPEEIKKASGLKNAKHAILIADGSRLEIRPAFDYGNLRSYLTDTDIEHVRNKFDKVKSLFM